MATVEYLYPSKTIEELLAILPEVDVNYDSRSFEAHLFHIVDQRPVRRTKRYIADLVQDDASFATFAQSEDRLCPWDVAYDELAIEISEMDASYYDERGTFVPDQIELGVLDFEGKFQPKPELRALPRYLSNTDDALGFKIRACDIPTSISISSREVDWHEIYIVSLSHPSKGTMSSYESHLLPHAIVGSVLLALHNNEGIRTTLTHP